MRPQALGLSLHGSAILLEISSDLVVKSHQKVPHDFVGYFFLYLLIKLVLFIVLLYSIDF